MSNQNTQQEKRTKIALEEYVPFSGTTETKLVTLHKVSETINKLFSVLDDYSGCVLEPNPVNGVLELSLYFSNKGGGDIIPLSQVDQGKRSILSHKIGTFNQRNSNKTLTISDRLKDVLSDFVVTGMKNKPINWNQAIVEMTEQSYNGYNIYIKIQGINLNKIFETIYGGRDGDGARVEYMAQIVKPIGQFSGPGQNWLISIMRLHTNAVEDLLKQVGMIPSTGSIPMVRV